MKRIYILTIILSCVVCFAQAQANNSLDKQQLADTLTVVANQEASVGKIRISRIRVQNNEVSLYTNRALSFLPLRPENVQNIKTLVSQLVLGHDKGTIHIYSDGYEIAELIPQAYRKRAKDEVRYQLPEVNPLTLNTSRAWKAQNGLDGKHLALYGSHGLYYFQPRAWWMYQRAKLLTTVEDLYTTSYVMPFLVPMLENAGAVVVQARERDTQTHEVIVDNTDIVADTMWQLSADSTGWMHPAGYLHEGDNPFTTGNYLYTTGEKKRNQATNLHYIPAIPEDGEYAVYISYKTLPNSTDKAQYTVVHQGISTTFSVNQQMGGSTWIYLGTFAFDAQDANHNYVTLSNQGKPEQVITSDAIRFGGGMGSVERYRNPEMIDNAKSSDSSISNLQHVKDSVEAPIDWSTAAISGAPRYMEGARYWFQYSGIPDSVYNYTNSQNDYIDDYASRGRWVNYLAGGSAAHPDSVGLRIPIHAGLAFHTDAGTTMNDDIIGTLMIYTDFNNDGKKTYPTGASRLRGRDYGDYMQTQITEDIRHTFAPEWNRRRLDNSSYSEARNPEVPMVLLELLSHQNFADMRYGLDPRFRFVVSRAIYKGMLRFIHAQYGTDCVVQPLPVQNFAIAFADNDKVQLTWKEQIDSLEPTAKADYYVVYTRINDGDWDNGVRVKSSSSSSSSSSSYELKLEKGKHYDFRVQAGNKGGVSLYSETLSAGISAYNQAKKVLIINGFTRVSAPDNFAIDSTVAGFDPNEHGVPYGKTLHYIGAQYEFDRSKPWVSDDDQGFGACYVDKAQELMAGNTFDYPTMHGRALQSQGYSYVSSSVAAIDSIPTTFDAVDIILGKQKPVSVGTERIRHDFDVYPINIQTALQSYTANGGSVLISGSYVAHLDKDAKEFARNTLHYEYRTNHATRTGQVKVTEGTGKGLYKFRNEPNAIIFHAENVTGLTPVGDATAVVARYADSGVSAATSSDDTYRTLVFGFPLESLYDFTPLYLQSIDWLTEK